MKWGNALTFRRRTGLLLALLGLAACALLSIMVGSRWLGVGTVLEALANPGGDEATDAIVWGLRVPRTGFGLAVGAALGMAGALMQGLTRNPLADPGLLGVSAGASLAVVLSTGLLGVTSLSGYIWFAFAGAAAASVVVFLLAARGVGGPTPTKLALAGAGVTAMAGSVTTSLLLADAATLDRYRFWSVGALSGQDPATLGQVLPFLLVGAVLAAAITPGMNLLALGEDTARGLGQRIGLIRVTGVVAITLLAGAGVAVCGPIAFVGLVVPHIARAICGADHRWVLALSAVLAPALLLAADVLGRLVAHPDELHVGIVVAALGAPFFIAFVRRSRVAEL
ncbi:iron chelate uptake ABC transporter family permease subunit [Allokutzneria multivorans]|uniref:Iron chelate uptake ABC transporter family permease subunit n=1 Tax=Allokutzneria multivorans TaxID=1142134 RepID=A0ABP7TWR8_9PSEU